MKVGVPSEVKDHEYRVGMIPAVVHSLVEAGHQVLVQTRAGNGSTIPDDEYVAAGGRIVNTPAEVWNGAELVVKVKEPQPSEYSNLRKDLILFTYLHLAADEAVDDLTKTTEALRDYLLNRTTILGETYEQRYNQLFRGGLRIHTTLKPGMQAAAERARDLQQAPAVIRGVSQASTRGQEQMTSYYRKLMM